MWNLHWVGRELRELGRKIVTRCTKLTIPVLSFLCIPDIQYIAVFYKKNLISVRNII